MGRKSKAALASIANASAKVPERRKATVEEASDSDDDFDWVPMPDLSDISDSEDEDYDSDKDSQFDEWSQEDDDAEIQNEADLLSFAQTLQKAQMLARSAERKRQNSRPKFYKGNSERSQSRWRSHRRALQNQGQQLIKNMFERRADPLPAQMVDPVTLREEEEESSDSETPSDVEMGRDRESPSVADSEGPDVKPMSAQPHADLQPDAEQRVREMLEELQNGKSLKDDSEDTPIKVALDAMNYLDFPTLRRARARLAVKGKSKIIDTVFRTRIMAMEATLNLYLDPELSYTWRQASLLAAKAQGHGTSRARNLRTWIHQYLSSGKLPVNYAGRYSTSILQHEDLSDEIHCHLVEIAKEGYISAQDVVDFVLTPGIQEKLGSKARGILLRTAQRWMKKQEWRYGKKAKGMYMDGHE
ncbi:hypothetical protein FIBSPDRAFT_958353 [Athelia psychrophila]|uniref:Uncharacterized protein n=1 Tax=Athelia psychrophila TaxID=1759441 RepID=A0A166EQS4_9AGAM|nr:hypothetical protein FIBSPDRAFT_958353 [Fibularhizoctonia sp. CBS 109695]